MRSFYHFLLSIILIVAAAASLVGASSSGLRGANQIVEQTEDGQQDVENAAIKATSYRENNDDDSSSASSRNLQARYQFGNGAIPTFYGPNGRFPSVTPIRGYFNTAGAGYNTGYGAAVSSGGIYGSYGGGGSYSFGNSYGGSSYGSSSYGGSTYGSHSNSYGGSSYAGGSSTGSSSRPSSTTYYYDDYDYDDYVDDYHYSYDGPYQTPPQVPPQVPPQAPPQAPPGGGGQVGRYDSGHSTGTLHATIQTIDSRYGQISGDVQVVFSPDGTFNFQYDIYGIEDTCVNCGIHIHDGMSCRGDGGEHYWDTDELGFADVWTVPNGAVYTPVGNGRATGSFYLYNGHDYYGNMNRAVIVHASDGTRVGCGLLA